MFAVLRLLLLMLLYGALWFFLAMTKAPEPPQFRHAPSVVGEHYAIEFWVVIEPHEDIRWITVQAWIAEPDRSPFAYIEPDVDRGLSYRPSELTATSDSKELTDRTRNDKVWHFIWRAGLDADVYVLVATIATVNYRPIKVAKHVLRVI